jgi:hypothetical protein
MPKLTELQTYDRLRERLEQLKAGKIFETRTLGLLLTDEQLTDLKAKIAQGKAAGKTVHTTQTAFIENIFDAMTNDLDNIADRMIAQAELEGAKVFMSAYSEAEAAGKNAMTEANAALTRRGFNRSDGVSYKKKLDEREEQVQAMEDNLRKRIEAGLSDSEREQLEHDRKVLADMERKTPNK